MPITTTTPFALSKGLSLSKARVEGLAAFAQGFDKLSPNGFFRRRSFDTSGRTGLGLNANNNDNTVRPEQGTEPVEGPRRRVGGMRARLRQAQPERDFFEPSPSIPQDERVRD